MIRNLVSSDIGENQYRPTGPKEITDQVGKRPVKLIRIQTIIPFSYPISYRSVIKQIDDDVIEALFHTKERKEILRLLGLDIFPDVKWRKKVIFFIHLNKEKTIDELDDHEIIQAYLEKCCSLVNQVSTAFRLAANEYFPRNYTLGDIIGYRISFSENKTNFFNTSTRTVDRDEDYVLSTSYYFQNQKIEINNLVNEYAGKLPLYAELLLNADDFYEENNFRMAVVEIETAVEYIITKMIEKNLSGKYEKEVNNFIFKNFERKHIDQKKSHLDLINPSITTSSEWNDWHKDCHKLRNDIIHGKIERPTKKQAEKAILAAKKLIELLKSYFYEWSDWLNEGIVLYSNAKVMSTELNEAEKYFQKSIEQNNTSNPLAMMYLGDIYCDKKEYYKSICNYKKSIEAEKSPECYFHLGILYEEMGIIDNALISYNEAIKLNFQVRAPYMNPYYKKFRIIERGKVLNFKEIIHDIRYISHIFPHEQELWIDLALALYYHSQYQNAVNCVSAAVNFFNDQEGKGWFLYMRARFHVKVNLGDNALKDLQESVRLDPSNKRFVTENDFGILKDNPQFREILK